MLGWRASHLVLRTPASLLGMPWTQRYSVRDFAEGSTQKPLDGVSTGTGAQVRGLSDW